MQALVVLAQSEGAVVARQDLIERCWGGVIVGEDAINRVMLKIRRLSQPAGCPTVTICPASTSF
jgi:DNA-binding winged helix-turn-helix (wHTH) protein